jgi:hypothetical protein
MSPSIPSLLQPRPVETAAISGAPWAGSTAALKTDLCRCRLQGLWSGNAVALTDSSIDPRSDRLNQVKCAGGFFSGDPRLSEPVHQIVALLSDLLQRLSGVGPPRGSIEFRPLDAAANVSKNLLNSHWSLEAPEVQPLLEPLAELFFTTSSIRSQCDPKRQGRVVLRELLESRPKPVRQAVGAHDFHDQVVQVRIERTDREDNGRAQQLSSPLVGMRPVTRVLVKELHKDVRPPEILQEDLPGVSPWLAQIDSHSSLVLSSWLASFRDYSQLTPVSELDTADVCVTARLTAHDFRRVCMVQRSSRVGPTAAVAP